MVLDPNLIKYEDILPYEDNVIKITFGRVIKPMEASPIREQFIETH